MNNNNAKESFSDEQKVRELNDGELTAASGGYEQGSGVKYSVGSVVDFCYDAPGKKGHSLDKGTIQGIVRESDGSSFLYLINGEKNGLITVAESRILKVY